jgi:putative SOS response-associated peptidase YedK
MCGRITENVTPSDLQEFFDVVRGLDSIDWTPRFNVAPTTTVICVRQSPEGREAFPAKWGLVPSWSKDMTRASSAINAKSETVAEKPMFRAAFKSRRCLVVASGFYEWQKLSAMEKQPYYITLQSGKSMGMAGLWENWKSPEGEWIQTCTICTTSANEMMAPFHDRMPVILPHAMFEPWLDPSLKDPEIVKPILMQYPSDEMRAWRVNKDIGNVRNQGKYLTEQI